MSKKIITKPCEIKEVLSNEIKKIILLIKSNCEKISSNKNPIGDDGLFHIIESLKANKENKISEIDLSKNKLHDIGIKIFAGILKHDKKISHLNLAENYIGPFGAKNLSENILFNRKLIYLNLNKNYIGTEGAKFLSEGLRVNKSLESIELSSNNIKSEGVFYLFKNFQENENLREINLDYNIIRDEGAKFIYEFLPQNKSIEFISLEYNIIEKEDLLGKIKALCDRNRNFNLKKNDKIRKIEGYESENINKNECNDIHRKKTEFKSDTDNPNRHKIINEKDSKVNLFKIKLV